MTKRSLFVEDAVTETGSHLQRNHRSRMEHPTYKEVVVVGNGPSAITLSYLLAGNSPYYAASTHPIDFLHYRLEEAKDKSLLEQDLEYLSDGLEGRSRHPVSLLFDALNHPEADLGLDLPSTLKWRHHPERKIDHVVLGKGLPGGAWQKMEGDTLTISLGSWMELPNFRFKDWYAINNRDRNGMRQTRATVSSVASYYREYVEKQGLSEYFVNYATVTSVRPIRGAELELLVQGVQRTSRETPRQLWEVTGHLIQAGSKLRFKYITPHVVLATGNSDKPNLLDIPGESLPFVSHNLSDLEHLISNARLNSKSETVVVVGAGLSAADAVIATRFHNIPTVHVFRRSVDDQELIFNKLPQNMYPEYHKVHQMMHDVEGEFYEGYKPYPQHRVSAIAADGSVYIDPLKEGDRDQPTTIRASYVIALIGMHPDLSFLPENGKSLGVHRCLPLDCKDNPVDVDAYTYQCINCPGMFAMGPLVGDNFVRFIQGAALGIASHLHKKLLVQADNAVG